MKKRRQRQAVARSLKLVERQAENFAARHNLERVDQPRKAAPKKAVA